LYDLQTKQLFHSRDIVFNEQVFPFKTTPDTFDVTFNEPHSNRILPSLNPLTISTENTGFTPSSFDVPAEGLSYDSIQSEAYKPKVDTIKGKPRESGT